MKQMITIMYWKVCKSLPGVFSFVNSCTSRQMILRLTFIVLVTIFGKPYKPCRDYSKTANNGLHMSINLFPIFPDFMAIFPLVTIFGNVHRPHQQYSNIVNDSLDHVYYLFPIFHDFPPIFALMTIFGNMHRPCKQYPDIVNNRLHDVYYFFLIFLNFWLHLY